MSEKINTKPFILHSDFRPSGDQPQAIEKLAENLTDGLAHQTLLGVTGSGKNVYYCQRNCPIKSPRNVTCTE